MRYLLLLVSCVAWGQSWYPSLPDGYNTNQSMTNSVIDATGEKVAACGNVWTPTSGSKSIHKVGFMFGSSITKAGGSALTLSLQDVDLATGPPIQPDGTPDQTVAIANASIAASTFLLSGALSADRSISFGDLVCVVIEFDGAGRLGADSITMASITRNGANIAVYPSVSLLAPTWADVPRAPIILFEFSDGTYGTLDGSFPFSAFNTTVAYNSGSGADEYALKFTVPTSGTITGVGISATLASGANTDIVLYSGTTALASVSIDQNNWTPTLSGNGFITFPATSVSAGTTYYIAVKPTTTNNVTLGGFTVGNSAYLGALPQGTGYIRSSRVDAGSWSDTATVVPSIRFRFTPSSSGGSSGGAYVVAQ